MRCNNPRKLKRNGVRWNLALSILEHGYGEPTLETLKKPLGGTAKNRYYYGSYCADFEPKASLCEAEMVVFS